MSTSGRGHPALLAGWVDDAAVFPPGSSPLPQALRDHQTLRAGRYADLLGPLLIGTSMAPGLVELLAGAGAPAVAEGPTAVTVVARPGTALEELLAAVDLLRGCAAVRLVGVEFAEPAPADLDRVLDLAHRLGASTAVELSRDALASAFEALAERAAPTDRSDGAGSPDRPPVLAKLRTQATAGSPPPTPGELARFLVRAYRAGLPVKLTGGLHRAVRHGTGADAEHGCLNVLVAAGELGRGADPDLDALVRILELRTPDPLVGAVRGWTPQDGDAARTLFRSFGCCGVLDPIGDLADLGLLTAPGMP